MNAPVTIKGWCPTALRPMLSGDGLLLRVPVRHATLHPADALFLAELSQTHGNGLIDLTQRANLQLRGVSYGAFPAIVDSLRSRGLIDEESGDTPVNIVCDPLVGLDPDAQDMRPLADAISHGLRADPGFAALPSKFGFALDGGGRFSLDETGADVRIRAQSDGSITIGIAGSALAAVSPNDAACSAALRLALVFLKQRFDERRMEALVACVGADAIFAQAGLEPQTRIPDNLPSKLLGLLNCGSSTMLGVAAPFGAWRAEDFIAVARRVAEHSGASIRVAPGRVLLLAGLSLEEAHRARADFASRGLIVSSDDRRLRVAACVGAPGCSSALGPTRALAADLAEVVPPGDGIALHVSGCAKGCAHPRAAPITLVGRAGAFDLVEHDIAAATPTIFSIASQSVARAIGERLSA